MKECLATASWVLQASRVVPERQITTTCVEIAGGIVLEGELTRGGVRKTGRVAKQRPITTGCVVFAIAVAIERLKTDGRVVNAGCEAEKRISPQSGVFIGIASARFRENCSRGRCERKPCKDEGKREQKETTPPKRLVAWFSGLLNCINCNPVPRGTKESSSRASCDSRLASADSGGPVGSGGSRYTVSQRTCSPAALFSRAER